MFPAQVLETKQAELIEFHPNARGFCLIITLDSESSSAPNGLPPNLLLSLESLVLVSFSILSLSCFLHPRFSTKRLSKGRPVSYTLSSQHTAAETRYPYPRVVPGSPYCRLRGSPEEPPQTDISSFTPPHSSGYIWVCSATVCSGVQLVHYSIKSDKK